MPNKAGAKTISISAEIYNDLDKKRQAEHSPLKMTAYIEQVLSWWAHGIVGPIENRPAKPAKPSKR